MDLSGNETLIEGFRIRDMVRETSDMIHQSIFCRKKSKETKVSFENSDRPSVQWCTKGHLSHVRDYPASSWFLLRQTREKLDKLVSLSFDALVWLPT